MTTTPSPDPLPEKYAEITQKALEFLKRAVDGNGLKAGQLSLQKQETELHRIPGLMTVELIPKTTEGQLKGNVPQGQVLGSRQAVAGHIEGLVPEFLKSDVFQQEIITRIEHAPGHGWGMEPAHVLLPETRKEFSVIDKCLKCSGETKLNCIACNTSGVVPCYNCQGFGLTPCLGCQGSGRIMQADGSQLQCMKCTGTGRVPCLMCRGTKIIACAACVGKGFIGCTECNLSGYWTHTYSVTYEAALHFSMNRTSLEPRIQEVIDKLGADKLGVHGHADIEHMPVELQEKRMVVPLAALLPVAEADFSVDGKAHPATVAGLNGRIVTMKPFMDPLIKPGINALLTLSKKSLVSPKLLMDTAYKYRLLRQVFSDLAGHSTRVVYQNLLKAYPLILSDKYARASVKYANEAFMTLSGKQRNVGLVIGTALSLGLALVYFFSPVRPIVLQLLQQKSLSRHILLADGVVWLLGYLIALYTVKFMAAKALNRFLPDIIKVEIAKLPSAGVQGFYAILTSFLAIFSARFLAGGGVETITALFKKLG